MSIPENTIYPRTGDRETVYLKNVVTDPNITVGDWTMYNDFVNDPRQFERNNVLYHYPVQPGPAGNRQILLDRLRRAFPVHQRQPHLAFAFPPIHSRCFSRNGGWTRKT